VSEEASVRAARAKYVDAVKKERVF
jgi:hypothetical protein